MATIEQLKIEAEDCLKKIEEQKAKLDEIAKNVKALSKPSVLPIGTRVRLKKNYNTDEYRRKWPGWRAYLHFMNPDNIATIKSVGVCDEKIYYNLTFDNQETWYKDEKFILKDYRWRFYENHIEKV